jgi:hypothetical protein
LNTVTKYLGGRSTGSLAAGKVRRMLGKASTHLSSRPEYRPAFPVWMATQSNFSSMSRMSAPQVSMMLARKAKSSPR